MRDLLKEMMQAIEAKAYYTALITAMAIPDICAALESSDGETDGDRYRNWFNRYASKHFQTLFNGELAWYIRCGVLHQGRLSHKKVTEQEIMIVTENKGFDTHLIGIKHADGKEFLVIELTEYCKSIYKSVIEWLKTTEATETYTNNYKKFFKKNYQVVPWDDEGLSVIAAF